MDEDERAVLLDKQNVLQIQFDGLMAGHAAQQLLALRFGTVKLGLRALRQPRRLVTSQLGTLRRLIVKVADH